MQCHALLVVNFCLHWCQCTRQKQRGLNPAAGYCSSLRTLLNHTACEPRRCYGSIVQFSALTGHTGGTGRTYQLDRCSPDYTPQDGPIDLSGEDNGLAGESCHDLLDCPCKSSWAVTAARPHPAHPPRRLLGLFHVFRPICLAACLGYLAYS